MAATGSNGGVTKDKNAMWIEKYRPKSLNDVAAHKEIIDTSEMQTVLIILFSWNLSICWFSEE